MLLGALMLLLGGCDDVFVRHPWEVDIPDRFHDLNAAAIVRTQDALSEAEQSFSFALVGDPHFHYDDLDDVIEHVNSEGRAEFILVAGDLTDQALTHEFIWYAEIATAYALPVISLIGNHDHLANGRAIYEQMFGPRNQVFHAGGVRFVLFDNVEFESDIAVDHAWLDAALSPPHTGHSIVFTHIQPTDVQLEGAPGEALSTVVARHDPSVVFMGHLHSHVRNFFPNGTPWVTAPWPERRQYLLVQVQPDTVSHEVISLP